MLSFPSCFNPSFISKACLTYNKTIIVSSALIAAILTPLGLTLLFYLRQLSGIAPVVIGGFFFGILATRLYRTKCNKTKQKEEKTLIPSVSNSSVQSLKAICTNYLLKRPELTRLHLKKLPTELIEEIANGINDPIEAKANPHFFKGVSLEKKNDQFYIKITDQFDTPYVENVLDGLGGKKMEYFLVDPTFSTQSLKAFITYIKDLPYNIILNKNTEEKFFFDLSDEEIGVFFNKLPFGHDDYLLFVQGLLEIPEPPTKEILKQKIEKIFTISEIMLKKLQITTRTEDDQSYLEIDSREDWLDILKILQVISKCTLMARHFYILSGEIDKDVEAHTMDAALAHSNWRSYLPVEERGILILHYMHDAIKGLTLAEKDE